MTLPSPRLWADIANAGRGFLMGAADIVPGVSGGTVALVLGIYQRLVTAISHVDSRLLAMVRAADWRGCAGHLDLRFLFSLGVGVATGIVGLASTMHTLLEDYQQLTFSAFFGLILASGILVGRMCRPTGGAQSAWCFVCGLLGSAAAFWLVSRGGMHNQPGLLYTFFCGSVGICAMILPGVSGSYLLLMLDKYEEITGILKSLPRLATTPEQLLTLVVFAGGCLLGLLVFSKVIRWLVETHTATTMAVLCGFMIGSLYKVWPFQAGLDAKSGSLKEQMVSMRPEWPTAYDQHTAACLAIAAACFFGVLALDAVARRSRPDEAVQL